jgi:hypothetical protein
MLDEKKFVRKNLQLPVTDVVKDRAVAIDLSFGRSAVGCVGSPHIPLDVDRCSRIPIGVATPTCSCTASATAPATRKQRRCCRGMLGHTQS